MYCIVIQMQHTWFCLGPDGLGWLQSLDLSSKKLFGYDIGHDKVSQILSAGYLIDLLS